MSILLKILLYLSACIYLFCESASDHAANADCKSAKKCYECIQKIGCKWCSEDNEDFTNTTERCFHNSKKCDNKAIENPKSEIITDQASKTEESSKFKPSKRSIKIRKGDKLNITFEYRDTENRPLDLYILTDLSCTMKEHIKKIETLADTLVKELGKLTKDLTLGFGSFVDKPMTPYVKKVNASGSKCHGIDPVPAYSFKNHLSLINDVATFKEAVSSTQLSTNVDNPEGGFDALMQAIVCSNEIGWRNALNSRRIIVFATDAPFHFAGDGKLAGIVLPNDGECHLVGNEYCFKQSTTTDYPSISQIKTKLQKHDIYVIFAVAERVLKQYKNLANELTPLSTAAEITYQSSSNPNADDKGSIVGVIQDKYKKLVGTVNLQARDSSSFKVNYYADCKRNGVFEKTSRCTDLEPGSTVQFKIEIELKECLHNNISSKTLEIAPSLGSQDAFQIEVEMLCGCQCENRKYNQNEETNDNVCNNNGVKRCGICKCNPNSGGKNCQCSFNSTSGDQSKFQIDCIKEGDVEPCSGRGVCDCGQCVCNKDAQKSYSYSGTFCECDDFRCEKNELDKGICNSEQNQGKCNCVGKCECYRGYTGSRCQCPPDDELKRGLEKCQDPADTSKQCNGNGRCSCEEDTVKCKCKPGYTGQYCGVHFAEASGCEKSIEKWQSCIRCLTLDNVPKDFSSDYRRTICKEIPNCTPEIMDLNFVDRITSVDVTPEVRDFEFNKSRHCRGSINDEKGCPLYFIVGDSNIHKRTTEILSEKAVNEDACPAGAASLYAIIGGVVGTTLLIGVLTLLIWKVLTHIHDKREYQKFEKDKENAAWAQDDNPMYQAPVSEFKNPAYSDH